MACHISFSDRGCGPTGIGLADRGGFEGEKRVDQL